MFKILGGRCSGKTHRLIWRAHRQNAIIVAPTQHMADYIWKQSSWMNVIIPRPISVARLLKENHSFGPDQKFMLDEADTILENILGIRFEAATFHDNNDERLWLSWKLCERCNKPWPEYE